MRAREHWEGIYTSRAPQELGWYEAEPETSLRLVEAALAGGARSIIDVGGGASHLVDRLIDLGVERIAVLDISEAGLALARRRLGDRASRVEWLVGDVTGLDDVGRFDIWHDRAVFHFLLDGEARRRYVESSCRTVEPGGTAIMATFAHDAPERCSGLPVQRYAPEELVAQCGPGWRLRGSERHVHITPGGVRQPYVYLTLDRVAAGRGSTS